MNSGYLLKGFVVAVIISIALEYLPQVYQNATLWYVLITGLTATIMYLSVETYLMTKRLATRKAS